MFREKICTTKGANPTEILASCDDFRSFANERARSYLSGKT
ncbi:hypothetical protein [uncultured Helicobacter sp.]